MKKAGLTILKVGISIAILAVLIFLPSNQEAFSKVWSEPKDWTLFALAGGCCLLAVMTTIVRWYWLVRALEVPFTLKDAFRLGFLGFLCNYISLGSVGGDLFKVVFLAREQPKRRAEAVASVVFDRLIGLGALLLVVTVATLGTGLAQGDNAKLRMLCYLTWALTGLSVLGFGAMLLPGFASGPVSTFLMGLRRAGPAFTRLIGAVRMYRQRMPVLLGSIAISVGTHALFVLSILLIARGLPGPTAELRSQFVIVPLGNLAAAVPLPGGGLGAYEASMELLYRKIPNQPAFLDGQGTTVAFADRAIKIVIAMIGLCYWLVSRREINQVWREAQAQASPDNAPEASAPHLGRPATMSRTQARPREHANGA